MATTYTLPASGPGTYNIHEHGHVRTYNRKSMTQRIPLQSTSMNGQTQSAEDAETAENRPKRSSRRMQEDSHGHPSPQESITSFRHSPHQHSYSTSQLLSPTPLAASSPHDRSQSMDRRKPILPTHLDLKDTGYGFPAIGGERHGAVTAQGTYKPRRWITGLEFLSSLLITVPYILISLTITPSAVRTSQIKGPVPDLVASARVGTDVKHRPSTNSTTSALVAFILTSVTLLMIGAIGKFRGAPNELDRKKATLGNNKDTEAQHTKFITLEVARRVTSRLLCVGLPIYAATNLGGYRVALIMLVALAGGLVLVKERSHDMSRLEGWRQVITSSKWIIIAIILQLMCDALGWTAQLDTRSTAIGYVSLGTSLLLLPPPFPSSSLRASFITAPTPRSAASTSAVVATPWEAPQPAIIAAVKDAVLCPLICTTQDTGLTIGAGAISAVFSILLGFFSVGGIYMLSPTTVGLLLLIACTMAASILLSRPQSLQESKCLGMALGAMLSFLTLTFHEHPSRSNICCEAFLVLSSLVASAIDTHAFSSHKHHDHNHHNPHQPDVQHNQEDRPSKITKFLVTKVEHISVLHSILIEKDSRRIFYFMILNFLFMMVQAFYGFATGSLGLLSDSIHMFFDCAALFVGLCAAVMSKWPPTEQFPYGYAKMDAIAGFANGIFLMLISIEIISDAFERLKEGRDIHRLGELFVVSSAGLVVNIIGLTAFGHAHHGHGHDKSGGGQAHAHDSHKQAHDTHNSQRHPHRDHDHGASNADHPPHDHRHDPHHNENVNPNRIHIHAHSPAHTSPLSATIPSTPSKPSYPKSAAKGPAPGHTHENENMHGIWLHVLADALGSVAVVISTILIHYFGWSGFDPLASLLIAIAIFASAVPLVNSTAKKLLLTMPEDSEFDVREVLSGISGFKGVVSYAAPRFWQQPGEEPTITGSVHIIVAKGTDMEDVRSQACQYLDESAMDIVVQVEEEMTGNCWCGQGKVR